MYNLPDKKKSVEEVQVVHGEQHQLGNLIPTQAQFRAVELTPSTNYNQGKMDNLTINDLTILLNNHNCFLALILGFQVSFETTIKRAKISTEMQCSHALINFSTKKSITPSDINESLSGFFTETSRPIVNTRDNLTRLTVALIHSQCHQFILRNLVKLNFNIYYHEDRNASFKIQPLWVELCRKVGLPIPGHTQILSPIETFQTLMNILELSEEEKKDMRTAILMLVHLMEVDETFNQFTSNLEPVQPLLNKAPEQGVSSGLLYVTDYVQIIVRMPNVFSLKQNCTLYSNLTASQLLKQTNLVTQLCSDTFKQTRNRSTTSCGVYLTEYTGTSTINLHTTRLDGLLATALTTCVEIILPTVTWEDLYRTGYTPNPTSQQKPTIRDKKNQIKDPWHSYKSLKISKNIMSSAPFIFTGEYLSQIAIITCLSPGNATLHERLENLQTTGAVLGLHQTIHNLQKQFNAQGTQMTRIEDKLMEISSCMKYAISENKYDVEVTTDPPPTIDIADTAGPQADILQQAVIKHNINNTASDKRDINATSEVNDSPVVNPPIDPPRNDSSGQIQNPRPQSPPDIHSAHCLSILEKNQQ